MKTELDEIMDGAAVSSVSEVSSKILDSLLISFIISLIGPSAYGIVSAFKQGSIITQTVVSGVHTGMKRTIPRLDKKEKMNIFITGLIISIIGLTGILTGIYLGRQVLYEYTLINKERHDVLIAGLVFAFGFGVFKSFSAGIQADKNISEANLLSKWLVPLFNFIVLYLLSVFIAMSAKSVIYGLSISLGVGIVISLYIIIKRTELYSSEISRNIKPIVKFLTYTSFATASILFTMFQFTAPNVLVFSLIELQAGAFGVGMVFGSISRVPLTAINTIFPQVATQLYQDGNVETINKLFKSTSKIAIFFMMPATIFFTVFHVELMTLFSDKYTQFSVIIPLIILGHLFAVAIGTVGLLIMMTDNERENIILQAFGSVTTLSIITPLTLRFEVVGLAAGYAITLIINNVMELFYLYYREGLWSLTKDHLKIISFSGFITGVLYIANSMVNLYISLPIAILTIICTTYINYTYFLKKPEKQALFTYKQKLLNSLYRKLK